MTISVGDTVTCINNDGAADYLILGQTYTVTAIISEDLINVDGIEPLVFAWRFSASAQ